MNFFSPDLLIFKPQDVYLQKSPLRSTLVGETFILGAFNPGLTRLPGGNLLMMMRVAEALKTPVHDDRIHSLRRDRIRGFMTDAYDLALMDATDPRAFQVLGHQSKVIALTSLSWLLPAELSPDGREVGRFITRKRSFPRQTTSSMGWRTRGFPGCRILGI